MLIAYLYLVFRRFLFFFFFFFFQAEDGIRDWSVTGVQTCALPISKSATNVAPDNREADGSVFSDGAREARRHPRPAPPPPLPCPAAWTPRRTPPGGAPSCA